MSLKNLVKNFILKIVYGYNTSEDYANYLRRKGISIGEGTCFYSPNHINIDITRPYGVTIGKNVHIARDVTILTHGFDWSVIKGKYNDVIGSFGEVIIGNNVFIGKGATILKGVHIGNDIIIAAESVVTKDCLENGVYAGSPAKFLYSLDEYYEKRIKCQVEEAKSLVKSYYKRYNRIPPKNELSEFFFLFEDRSNTLPERFLYQMNVNGNFNECDALYKIKHRQEYSNYDEFINICLHNVVE